MKKSQVTRRVALSAFGAGVGSAMLAPGARAAGNPPAKLWRGPRSANGWPIGSPASRYSVEGSGVSITLADGLPSSLLLHAARRINYELDVLREGDLTGLVSDRAVASDQRSNLLSGTAFIFRSGSFPHGVRGGLFPFEILILEDIVAEAGGVLGWGGHLPTPDEGLIYLTQGPSSGSAHGLARKFEVVDRMDSSSGVGSVTDSDRSRRQRRGSPAS